MDTMYKHSEIIFTALWKNACFNHCEFDLEVDLVGYPIGGIYQTNLALHYWALYEESLKWWLWIIEKRNLTICTEQEFVMYCTPVIQGSHVHPLTAISTSGVSLASVWQDYYSRLDSLLFFVFVGLADMHNKKTRFIPSIGKVKLDV